MQTKNQASQNVQRHFLSTNSPACQAWLTSESLCLKYLAKCIKGAFVLCTALRIDWWNSMNGQSCCCRRKCCADEPAALEGVSWWGSADRPACVRPWRTQTTTDKTWTYLWPSRDGVRAYTRKKLCPQKTIFPLIIIFLLRVYLNFK